MFAATSDTSQPFTEHCGRSPGEECTWLFFKRLYAVIPLLLIALMALSGAAMADACIDDLQARSKTGKIQLSWADRAGTEKYRVSRSDALAGPFTPLGEVFSPGAVYLDGPVPADTVFYYRIERFPLDGSPACLSVVIAAMAPASRTRMAVVPNVIERTEAQAVSAISAEGLAVGNVATASSPSAPAGDVISQDPPANSWVPKGTSVHLVVSSGTDVTPDVTPPQVSITSPSDDAVLYASPVMVSGIATDDVTLAGVTVNGVAASLLGDVFTASVALVAGTNALTAVATDAAGNSTSVSISVTFAPPVTVPDVTGQEQADAEAAIVDSGLVVGNVDTAHSDTVPAGKVLAQDPPAGTSVALGSAVNLVISSGPALVVVPDVVGQAQTDAEAAIAAAGLSVGTLALNNSDTVPAGNVISQDPPAGTSVAPGRAVNLVVSLGPAQVIVPDVTGSAQAAAESTITAAGLVLGTVSEASSDTVEAGEVIAQDPPAGTLVAPGSSVDLVVSTGPAASGPAVLSLRLSAAAVTAGDTIDIIPEVLDGDGNPVTPLPSITYAITFGVGEASGTVPTEHGGVISTSGDTRGVYSVTGTVDGTAVSGSAEFVVFRPAAESGQKALYAGLSTSVETIRRSADSLAEALAGGDIAAVQSALDAMRSARDAVDLTAMRRTTVFAPEGGFLPTLAELAAAGFPETADDAALQGVLQGLIDKIQETSDFYDALNAAGPNDDDAKLTQLNTELQALLDQLNALDPTVHGWVKAKGLVNHLYAVVVPRYLHSMVNRYEQAILDEGIGIVYKRTPGDFYRSLITPQPRLVVAPMGPREFYEGERPAFFSLAGMSIAVQIQMRIVTDVYGPILHDLARSAALLVANDLLNRFVNNLGLHGIVTGASLSFHIFNAAGSFIEVSGANREIPGRSDVFLVGSAAIAAVEDLFNALNPDDFEDLDDVWEFFEGVVEALEGAGEAFDDANQVPGDLAPGCILSSNPSCVELIYPSGFKPVIKCSGFICLPQPVLVLVHNLDTGTWAFDLFNFLAP